MSCKLGKVLQISWDELLGNVAEIKQQLYQHQIIIIDDIDLTPQQFTQIASAYGAIVRLPNARGKQGVDGFDHIIKIVNDPIQGYVPTANFWHADQSWCRLNPNSTFFYSRVVPTHGGETRFVDTRSAFQDLSQDIQLLLRDKVAYYRHNKSHIKPENFPSDHDLALEHAQIDAYHDLAPEHPFTGLRSLYDPTGHCDHVMGMNRQQSDELLMLLRQHITQEHRIYRHQYKPNQLIFWDNFSLVHCAPDPIPHLPRELWQIRVRDQDFFAKKIGSGEPIAILDHKV